jgi:Fur family peroxide stress response transcriptional regulator
MTNHREARLERVRDLEERCRRHGLPVTVQRRAIFEYLAGREDHPTADQIFNAVQTRVPGVSRTTVYRVLDTLIRIGILSKACHPGGATRFDAKSRRHHHFVCSVCDRLVDVEDPRLDALELPAVKKKGFRIRSFSVLLHGICPDCREKSKENRPEGGSHA